MAEHLSTEKPTLVQTDAENHAKKCSLPRCRYGYRKPAKHAAPKET